MPDYHTVNPVASGITLQNKKNLSYTFTRAEFLCMCVILRRVETLGDRFKLSLSEISSILTMNFLFHPKLTHEEMHTGLEGLKDKGLIELELFFVYKEQYRIHVPKSEFLS